MPKIINQPVTAGGSADDIEVAFHGALQTADLEKRVTCWPDEEKIVCAHPGSEREAPEIMDLPTSCNDEIGLQPFMYKGKLL